MIKLFADTNSDLTPEIAKEYGSSLISMPFNVNNLEVYPYIDFEKFEYNEFYDMLRSGVIPSTCAISPEKYIEYFEPVFANGDDALYVHFSSAMSGTFNALEIALDELKGKYPERSCYLVDTMGISINSLAIVKEIGQMNIDGKSIEEILNWASAEVKHFATYFFANDLRFFKRSGRISNFSSIMGTIVGVKPIIYMDENGSMTNVSKARGKMGALRKILEYVDSLQLDIDKHKVIIAHSDALELAEKLAEMLQEKYNNKLDIEYSVVNPTIGSHCGPDCVGVCFHAIHK